MKHVNKFKLKAAIILCCLLSGIAKGQWNTYPTMILIGNNFTQVDENNKVESAGIGDFKAMGKEPLSSLHINTNWFFNYTPLYPLGEVFRSDCPRQYSSFWRMFKGTTDATNEYGRLHSYSFNDDVANYPNTLTGEGIHFTIQSSFSDNDRVYGDLRFNTPGLSSSYAALYPRMRILGGSGNVGIGDYNTFIPTNLEHLHIANSVDGHGATVIHNVYEQFTNGDNISSPTQNATDGFRVGITFNQGTGVTDGELIQRQNSQIKFYTDIDNFVGSTMFFNTSPAERMRIGKEVRVVPGTGMFNGTFHLTRVAITEGSPNTLGQNDWNGPNSTPLSLLHLGQAWQYNAGGHRPWMDVGTYYGAFTDMLYIGAKEESHGATPGLWTTRMDAVVGWGDNTETPEGADNLRFIFTALQNGTTGDAGDVNGLEVARISPFARMGIGNFTTPAFGNGSGIQPHRRLEIYDESVMDYGDGNHFPAAPQLRLTFTPNAIVANGIWTDFQTTSIGDLYIHPYGVVSSTDATVTNRNVGINDATPGNTLEITSSPNTAVSPELAGLRFTNLTNGVAPIANPDAQNGVLSVDNDGDVIFVIDEGGDGDITGCTGGITTGNVNFITKISAANEICNSAFWENTTFDVGIGIPTVTAIGAQLQVECGNNNTGIWGINTSTPTSSNYLVGVRGQADASIITTANTSIGGYFDAKGSTTENIGVDGFADYPTAGKNYGAYLYAKGSSTYNMGVLANAIGVTSGTNIGGHFETKYGATNYGVAGIATTAGTGGFLPSPYASLTNINVGGLFFASDGVTSSKTTYGLKSYATNGFKSYGVESIASAGIECYGVAAEATGGTSCNYAIYAVTTSILSGTTGTISVTSPPADAAGFFDGDVFTTAHYFEASDAMLKQNVTDITNATSIINQLHPKTYNYDTLQFGYMALSKGQQYGLLAQELDSVLPQFVKPLVQPEVKDSVGNVVHQQLNFKGVTYGPLITLLLAGFKEQQQQIDDLQTQLDNCCGAPRLPSPSQGNDEKTGAIEIKLVNADNYILYQNQPNPYQNETTIRYFIPENTSDVKITFQDATGKTLKEVQVNETGQGSIKVDGSELISGIYTYSLVIGDKIVDTKKMVKQ